MTEVGQINVSFPKKDGQGARQITLTIRFGELKILPPTNSSGNKKRKPIALNIVSAVEENPVPGEKASNWLFLTTLVIENWEDALCCLLWYTYHWLIERYHYVLMYWLWDRKATKTESRTDKESSGNVFDCSMEIIVADVL